MERRIKALYIITIIAIVGFLGMQSYWLYSRYEYSLAEYEDQLYGELLALFDDYRDERIARKNNADSSGNMINQSSMSMRLTRDSVGVKRFVGIKMTTLRYTAQEILGLPPDHVLTPDEKRLASEKIIEHAAKDELENGAKDYDASGAPSDGDIWVATQNLEIESVVPLRKEDVDSVLRQAGYDADVRLSVSDSIVWTPTLVRHVSAMSPSIHLIVPYSQLEKKIVEIDSPITVSDVLSKMLGTLLAMVTLSVLLIICLVGQFSTILKQNRIDKVRNNFVSTMIHELKRPISTLKMCVSGIENDRMLADAETKRELVAESRDALNNLSAYFSRLRDLSFNNPTQIPLDTSQFSLREAVGEIISKVPANCGKTVAIADSSEHDILLSADRIHVINILNNLVENSIKYSGDEVAVDISYRESGEDVMISVSDNGDGISPADCKKIFERFYRSRSAIESDRPGMGLGLAYIRLLVEAHGGDVSVESREGEGTCFTIRFPQ